MANLTNIDSQARNYFKYSTVDKFLPNLLQIALAIGAIITFMYLIWGGINYVISGGNQDRAKTAKEMITNALTGLIILASVWIIWRLIAYFTGISDSISGPFKLLIPSP